MALWSQRQNYLLMSVTKIVSASRAKLGQVYLKILGFPKRGLLSCGTHSLGPTSVLPPWDLGADANQCILGTNANMKFMLPVLL